MTIHTKKRVVLATTHCEQGGALFAVLFSKKVGVLIDVEKWKETPLIFTIVGFTKLAKTCTYVVNPSNNKHGLSKFLSLDSVMPDWTKLTSIIYFFLFYIQFTYNMTSNEKKSWIKKKQLHIIKGRFEFYSLRAEKSIPSLFSIPYDRWA